MRFWTLPKPVGIAIAGYELLALSTNRLPTITQICNRYPPVGLLIIAWLIDHLFISKDKILWSYEDEKYADASNGESISTNGSSRD